MVECFVFLRPLGLRLEITIPDLFRSGNWNEYNLNSLTRTNWRASLVPAAAVIPAPIAYIKVVAVKRLVVDYLTLQHCSILL